MAKFDIEKTFMGRPKLVMQTLGVWLPVEDENFRQKAYTVFMLFLQYSFLIFQIINIFQVWGDLEAVSQSSYLAFTQSCLCFKITVFLANRERLRELLYLFNSEAFKPLSKVHERILERQAARIKLPLMVFLIFSQATCCSWCMKPLFDSEHKEFPFPMWMPLHPDNAFQYAIGYAYQAVTISLSAFMYFGVDSVALTSVFFGCAQINVIQDKIRHKLKNVTEHDRAANREKELFNENYKELVECVKQHQTVLRVIGIAEDAYHAYLLFQLSGGVGLICMSALLLLVVDWKSVQFLSVVLYVLVMIVHMFACCWCGHELTVANTELFVTLYLCPWYEQDVKFKRTLCFTMLRMSRPLVFRAGHYVPLSRQTFVSILRMSYSYFAVLRQTR